LRNGRNHREAIDGLQGRAALNGTAIKRTPYFAKQCCIGMLVFLFFD